MYQIIVNPKQFADIPPQKMMLIPTPRILNIIVKQFQEGIIFYGKS